MPLAVGLAYALADRGRTREALRLLDGMRGPEVHIARAQLLHWMGRLGEAQREAHAGAAAFPEDVTIARFSRDLDLQYGHALAPGFRVIGDSDGVSDRTWSNEFSTHWTPSHRFHAGFLDRRMLQENTEIGWRQYEAGWSGVISRSLAASAALADHEYFSGLRRWTGDASVSVAASDRVQVFGGAGVIAMDAFRSVAGGVTGRFWMAGATWRVTGRSSLDVRTSRYFFSDGVSRTRLDAAGFRALLYRPRLRLDMGWRTNYLWHDRETPDFFSPAFFQTHLAEIKARASITRKFECHAAFSGGLQREPNVKVESPLQVSAGFTWRWREALALHGDAGRTTASVERVNPGRVSYSRSSASLGITFWFREMR